MNLLEQAAELAHQKTKGSQAGWTALGEACGVSYVAVKGWAKAGRLPLPCLVGLQDYHKQIAKAVDNEITAKQLLDWSRQSWEEYYGK